jgi:outer membrane protein OmpA-like peptidoglycan-associated protein
MIEGAILWFAVLTAALFMPNAMDSVVLLPSQNGRGSAVIVQTAKGNEVLSQSYAQLRIAPDGALAAEQTNAAEVVQRYPELFSLKPQDEIKYLLYFKAGSTELSPESQEQLLILLAEIKNRIGGEAVVIGYTDRVGNATSNDALSLLRAKSIAAMLVERGIPAQRVLAVGRGEREPIVPTPAQTDEPRNRRVEVLVR